jgi:hypothetical protein
MNKKGTLFAAIAVAALNCVSLRSALATEYDSGNQFMTSAFMNFSFECGSLYWNEQWVEFKDCANEIYVEERTFTTGAQTGIMMILNTCLPQGHENQNQTCIEAWINYDKSVAAIAWINEQIDLWIEWTPPE